MAPDRRKRRLRIERLPLGPDPSRPGGPPAKRQPSPEGLGWDPHHDPARPGLPWERQKRGTHLLLNVTHPRLRLEARSTLLPLETTVFLRLFRAGVEGRL